MPNKAHKRAKNETTPTIVVRVTAKHIDEALPCNGAKCMISEAVADAYGRHRALYLKTDLTGIRFSDPDRDRQFYYFHTPKSAEMLMKFDAGEDIRPFSFTLHGGVVNYRIHRNTSDKPKRKKNPGRQGIRGVRRFGACAYTPGKKR